jgi:hypothetical protein
MQSLPSSLFLAAMLLGASGCAVVVYPVHKEKIVTLPVDLPMDMCADQGVVAVSAGKPGERMVCELHAVTGTHVPRCICRDEGMIAQQTVDTQQLLLDKSQGFGYLEGAK